MACAVLWITSIYNECAYKQSNTVSDTQITPTLPKWHKSIKNLNFQPKSQVLTVQAPILFELLMQVRYISTLNQTFTTL